MSAAGSPPLDGNGDTGATAEEAALARVLESYLARLEAGGPADAERLIAAHPELARPLRACLKVMHLAEGLDAPAGTGALVSSPPPGSSTLTVLWPGDDRPPRVLLPEPPEDDSPIVRTHSDALADSPGGAAGRYQVLGESARGGMGVVLKARDADLGRDLALKVLLDRHRGDQDIVRRFVEEAQIGGQLQHPGIVPVHELGTLDDRRPFFTMKLVKGRTLAALLAERNLAQRANAPHPNPPPQRGAGTASDLRRFLAIFEQVCQTVAYAHARRVIHRDLKPANVMVGNFGEVQVMDWGLAKVLPEGGIADEAKAMRNEETVIQTVRSGSAGSGSESQAGSVLGTPSYMAPEQARGELNRVDERADVFGLGAILCEVLTGRAPYTGSTREEIRAQAARGDLGDALGRLDSSGADAELIGLARDCLAAEPERRPRSARPVAHRVTAYLVGVQERLKAAELAQVEAQTRAEEAVARATIERSRRRRTVALAASVLVTAGVIGGGWTYLARQSQERATQFNRALGQAEGLYAEAQRSGDDPGRWLTAREAAHVVERLVGDAPDQSTRTCLIALVRDVTQAAAAAENDQELLAKLDDIRSSGVEDIDGSVREANYADAFREAGMDMAALTPAEAGAKIHARPPAGRVALAAALDGWAAVRGSLLSDKTGARRLAEVARVADPDPWRNRLRELFQPLSTQDRLTKLKDLAKSAQIGELPAVSLHLLGATLLDMGDPTGSEAVRREAQRRYPGDVWLNYTLARCLARLGRAEEGIRYDMAARSLRPETAHAMAHALDEKGETDQAIAIFQDLARIRPKDGGHLACLGKALQDRGRSAEAKAVLDAAIAASRAAIGLQPVRWDVHNDLGTALKLQGKLAEAADECREALRLKPDSVARRNLAEVLSKQGKFDEAIAEHREALQLKPDSAEAHDDLGITLMLKGSLDEAVAEHRAALRLKPDSALAHVNLGSALVNQGKLAEAIAEYRGALRLKPGYAQAHNNLGTALLSQGSLDAAIAEFRTALQIMPDSAFAYCNLGLALDRQGKLDEAIADFHTALRNKPDFPNAHAALGLALRSRGEYTEAIAELRKARDLAKTNPRLAQGIERELAVTERQSSLAARLPSILRGTLKLADHAEALDFAQLCYDKKLHGASARLWEDAFKAQPALADDMKVANRYNAACSAALAGSGQGKDDPPLDDATKARWRKQALDWLKADLMAWSKLLESGPPQARQAVPQTLQHWKADSDLAGIRDEAALVKLHEAERKACRALWAEVEALLAKASAGTKP